MFDAKVVREGFWILGGQILTVVGALVSIRILTELLTPQAYGELALGMTFALLANQLVFGPFSQGAARFYSPAIAAQDLGGYLDAIYLFGLQLVLAVALLSALLGLLLFLAGWQTWSHLIFASSAFAIASGLNATLSGIQNAARQRAIVAIHQGLEMWFRVLFASVLLICFWVSSSLALWGFTIAMVVILLSQWRYFHPIRRLGASQKSLDSGGRDWRAEIWRYSWPFGSWGIFSWAQRASDRWALAFFAGLDEVGLYAVVYQLGYYPVTIATDMGARLIAPIFFDKAGDGTDQERAQQVRTVSYRIFAIVLTLTFFATAVTHLIEPYVLDIFLADAFSSIEGVLPVIVFSGGLYAGAQILTLILMTEMKTRRMVRGRIVIALVALALNFFAAYHFGIIGIVWAGVLASSFHIAWILRLIYSAPTAPKRDRVA